MSRKDRLAIARRSLKDRSVTIDSSTCVLVCMYVCMYYVCMYVWSSHTYSRVRINRVRLPILLVVS